MRVAFVYFARALTFTPAFFMEFSLLLTIVIVCMPGIA